MSAPQLRAEFFVRPDGVAFRRAERPKRSYLFRFFQQSNRRCGLCGVGVRFGGNTISPWDLLRAGHVDHIFPISRGGGNEETNLRVLCISCNASKGAR